ncbi:unnamed protein product [Trichogramma brassicae]|uniref:CRAL-TRIO domain-containing protein n=1 Tax=Trichogramma brassicae TaxID=86971 RepID=A0A6H5I7H8_9HYME|nr:unnamed protein product [Trichogramma brassicae]
MVQQYQSPVRVYKYPFALVMMAYERRFPTCPQIPVFVGCDVTLDEESEDGAIRTTERRCKLNVDAPYLLKKIIGVDFVYFIQKNILDRRNNVLEIEAYNESFASRVTVLEKCRYFIHPENPEWTCFEQTASLDIKNFFGFENSMEKLAMKQYAQNIAKMQLSSDYIERYLGKLDMMQESKLVQLRHSIEELRPSSVPSDATLLRFLRAREFSVDKAREMLTQSLHWRKKHQIDKLLEEYEAPQVVKDYFPGGWHHFDREGRPLYVLRLGQMDVKGLLKSIGEDELLLLALHICEEGLSLMDEATNVWGHPVSQWTLLIDLEGLNMRHLWRPGIKALLRIIEIVEANYPETMGRVLILRAPRCFPILWTLISTFIHENTRNKFVFYCGTDYQEQGAGGLSDNIDPEYIPDFLGGTSETYVLEGGVVPKNLYRADLEGTSAEHEHSLYHSVSLSRGQTHNVAIHCNDPGAVLTWDFDVMRNQVLFAVLHKEKSKDSNNTLAAPGATTVLEPDVVGSKEWKEGLDGIVRVEPSVVCHDGESIQGTHIMQEAGIYILQWQNPEEQGEFLPSISSHKAQLMYYYETLPSAHYKGSMMSLQSAISGRSVASSSLSR